MDKPNIFIIGISSPSGGGKTTVAKRVSELLADTVTIFFDDYDFDTIHPESYRKWLEEGANYNAWKTSRLTEDLRKLKAGQSIVSPDGLTLQPRKYVVFDAPLGYAHAETGAFIDFMVYIDTPLDVAMARRLLRNFPSASDEDSKHALDSISSQLTAYLDYGRRAYLEMDSQVKPYCDLVLDGCLPVDGLASKIVQAVKARASSSSLL